MSPNCFSYQFNQTKYPLYIHLKLINEGANMSFSYYANTGDSHHYNDQDVVVRSGRTLSTVSVLAFFSATIFDIPNIFLIVFSKHVLCSSIEAWTNSSMWSIKSATNEASSDFFFLHDLISGVVDDNLFSEAESIWGVLSIMGSLLLIAEIYRDGHWWLVLWLQISGNPETAGNRWSRDNSRIH